MLLLALSLAGSMPIAVEVVGMKPQIDLAIRAADAAGWRQTCRGASGEQIVLRFALPAGWSDERIDNALGGTNPFVSGYSIYRTGESLPQTCNQEPAKSFGDPSSVLAVGLVAKLAPMLKLARSCGFRTAHIRDLGSEDKRLIPKTMPSNWKVLDAGEDTSPRYGPSICVAQLQTRSRP